MPGNPTRYTGAFDEPTPPHLVAIGRAGSASPMAWSGGTSICNAKESDFTSCDHPVNGHFVAYSDEFHEVVGNDPQFCTVIETDAHEGPVYVGTENALCFTTVPASSNIPVANSRQVAIRKISLASDRFPLAPEAVTTVRGASNMANGMTLDRDGRLVICEQGTKTTPARISRLDIRTGALDTVVDQWRGLRFNSPNDVVVKSDGTVWFTDPSYGALQGFKDAPLVGDYVYRYDPATQQTSVVADSFSKPNGLAFSPDESILYINDSAAIQGPGTYFANLPHHIRAFGGPGNNVLYMMADTRIWAARIEAVGATRPQQA